MKKFLLPLIAEKKNGDKFYSASKGNIMCWIVFILLMGLSVTAFLKIALPNVKEVTETLRYIFTTTFMYSFGKKGVDVLGKNK